MYSARHPRLNYLLQEEPHRSCDRSLAGRVLNSPSIRSKFSCWFIKMFILAACSMTTFWLLLTSLMILQVLQLAEANDQSKGTIDDLEIMFAKLEMDTAAFARKMENLTLPVNRCSKDTIRMCAEGNYHACDSELPYAS